MGREELARALEKKGAQEVEAIWQQARSEVAEYRRRCLQEAERQRHACDREAADAALAECRKVAWRVTSRVRRLRLGALQALDRRLRTFAREELGRIMPVERGALLAQLAAEVPENDWALVQANPADCTLMETVFPGVRVAPDVTIIGGFVIETSGGGIRVDNTLGGRLEKRWPELCGEMLAELEGRDEETA